MFRVFAIVSFNISDFTSSPSCQSQRKFDVELLRATVRRFGYNAFLLIGVELPWALVQYYGYKSTSPGVEVMWAVVQYFGYNVTTLGVELMWAVVHYFGYKCNYSRCGINVGGSAIF